MKSLELSIIFLYFSQYCYGQSNLNITEDPYHLDRIEELREDYDKNREALVHRLCTHRSRFTEQEIETARVYIQNRYLNGASVKPQKPACKAIKVIRDFKCLSHEEKLNVTDGFKQLYAKGVIDRISYFHGGYWPFVHLLAQVFAFHNRFLLDLQHEMEKINPSVIIPYWDTTLDFAAPEKSIIWDYFGRAGNESNDYCVPDGPFKNQTVQYPTPHCIRRQWNTDGTIPAWESPEVLTSLLQQSVESFAIFGPFFDAQHFKKHLNIGGYNGDISIPYATNEPLFHLFHIYEMTINVFKWQLEKDSNLVDLELNYFGRHEPLYDYEGSVVRANIKTDTVLSYNTTTVAEAMTLAFGEFCYISDQIIEHVNNIANNRKPKFPAAVDRLRNALPAAEFAKYFPKFASNTATELNSLLVDVGSSSSSSNHTCKQLPLVSNFSSTENGMRQFERFRQIGADIRLNALTGEERIVDLINTLNKYNYCSPYL